MNEPDLRIIIPDLAHESAYARMLADYAAAGDAKLEKLSPPDGDFPAYVRRLHELSRGIDLPPAHVPWTTYWLIEKDATGEEIVGSARLRHHLNEIQRDYGGHIGYDVRPSHRNRGYATRLLAMMLKVARAMHISEVLLTCDSINVASARVIEKNGGLLQDEGYSERAKTTRRRYWIKL